MWPDLRLAWRVQSRDLILTTKILNHTCLTRPHWSDNISSKSKHKLGHYHSTWLAFPSDIRRVTHTKGGPRLYMIRNKILPHGLLNTLGQVLSFLLTFHTVSQLFLESGWYFHQGQSEKTEHFHTRELKQTGYFRIFSRIIISVTRGITFSSQNFINTLPFNTLPANLKLIKSNRVHSKICASLDHRDTTRS